MDDTGPRTIRPAENASSEQASGTAPIINPESEQRTGLPQSETVEHDGNTDGDLRAPSRIVRVPGQDDDQAQRQADGTSGGFEAASQGSNGDQRNPPATVLENKQGIFERIAGNGKQDRIID